MHGLIIDRANFAVSPYRTRPDSCNREAGATPRHRDVLRVQKGGRSRLVPDLGPVLFPALKFPDPVGL